jgi:hypothetical protein
MLTGATIDEARIVVGERLRAGSSDEVREGTLVGSPDIRVLITLTAQHTESHATIASRMRLELKGIAPLLYVGPAREPYVDALVERLPAGRPARDSAPWSSASAMRLGYALATVVARIHAAGELVGAIRPELVYVDDNRDLSALVPRGPRFIATAAQPMHGRRTYAVPYSDGTALTTLQPSAASEVFAIAATLFTLRTGSHPFGDERDPVAIFKRIVMGAADRWPAEDSVAKVLDAALDREASKRPSAADLAAALRGS